MLSTFDDLRIRDFLFFDRLAALGSLTAAAGELGIPKATASRWLAQIEERVGQPLVRRTTRRVALSESGVVFRESARELLKMVATARVMLTTGASGGTLRVSVPVPMGRMLAGPVIAAFRRQAPGVRLEIRLQNERVDLLEEGIDVAIRGGPLPDSSLVARKLARVPLWLYASARYRNVPLREVPLIAAPGDEALLRRSGFAAEFAAPAVVVDDRTAVADALAWGAGAGVLPAFLGEQPEQAESIVRVSAAPIVAMPVHAVYHPSQRGDPRVALLVEEVERQLGAVL